MVATAATTTTPPQPPPTRTPSKVKPRLQLRLFALVAALLALFALTALLVTRQSLLFAVHSDVGDRLGDAVGAYRAEIDETATPRETELQRALQAVGPTLASETELALYADEQRRAMTEEFVVPGLTDETLAPGAELTAQEAEWASLTESRRGTLADGHVYLAVPILAGDTVDGVLVATTDASDGHATVGRTLWIVAAALCAVLLAGLLLTWWAAGRLVRSRMLDPDGRMLGSARGNMTSTPTSDRAAHRGAEPDEAARRETAALSTSARTGGSLGRPGRGRRVNVTARRETVELDRVALEIYTRSQRLAEREWVLDVPSRERAHIDPSLTAMAASRIVENAVSRTSIGDTIVVGADVRGGTTHIHVTTMAADEQCAGMDAADRFAALMDSGTEDGRRATQEILRVVEAHHGVVHVDCALDTGVRVELVLPNS